MVGLGEHDLSIRGGDNRPRLDEGMPEGLASAAEPGDPGASSPVEQLIEASPQPHDVNICRLLAIYVTRLDEDAVFHDTRSIDDMSCC